MCDHDYTEIKASVIGKTLDYPIRQMREHEDKRS